MNRSFDELRAKGIVGILAFWIQMALIGMSIASAIFAMYWMAITASKIWLKAVGGSLLAANVFLMLTSLASGVFLVLNRLNINPLYPNFSHHLSVMAAFISQIICCVLMGLSTESEAEIYLKDILDYCERNTADQTVQSFTQSYTTDYSKRNYVAQRTTTAYDSVAAIFGVWLPLTLIYILCVTRLDPEPGKPKANDHEPLHTNDEEHPNEEGDDVRLSSAA